MVNILCDTLPAHVPERCRLITFLVETPLFVWTQLLTHRRFARNAASSRALSANRRMQLGYYTPEVFYTRTDKMRAVDPADNDALYRVMWHTAHSVIFDLVQSLNEQMPWAKEQINRLLPQTLLTQGIVTGTYAAWRAFLDLRLSEEADTAMQSLAIDIETALRTSVPSVRNVHLPLVDEQSQSGVLRACAKLARVSFLNTDKTFTEEEDLSLARRLIEHKHWSPFEHVAFWTEHPTNSAFTCTSDDVHDSFGWVSYRHMLEGKAPMIL